MTMLVLPQCVNMAVILVKETAVLSVIAVPEAGGRGKRHANLNFESRRSIIRPAQPQASTSPQ
jgi:ABC-type amino acid transport system permease subunit